MAASNVFANYLQLSQAPKFLVTGASSHLAYHLIRQLNITHSAKNILALDIKDPERSLGCKFLELNILDKALLREETLKWAPTHVIHMA